MRACVVVNSLFVVSFVCLLVLVLFTFFRSTAVSNVYCLCCEAIWIGVKLAPYSACDDIGILVIATFLIGTASFCLSCLDFNSIRDQKNHQA